MGRKRKQAAVARTDDCRVRDCPIPRECGQLWCMVHGVAIRDRRTDDAYSMSTFLRSA